MMKNLRTTAWLAAAATVAAFGPAAAQAQKAARPMIEWVSPATESNKPQTAEQAEQGRERGPRAAGARSPAADARRAAARVPAATRHQDHRHVQGRRVGRARRCSRRSGSKSSRPTTPSVTLSIAPPYAGSLGAIELVKGNLDFVFVSRELKPDDIKQFKAEVRLRPAERADLGRLVPPLRRARRGGLLRPQGQPDRADHLRAARRDVLDDARTRRQARSRRGAISASTGEWADKPIKLYGIKPWNGFEEFVRQRVLSVGGKRGEWRDDINFEKVVFPMAKDMADDRYGIGYSGMAYIDAPVQADRRCVEKAGRCAAGGDLRERRARHLSAEPSRLLQHQQGARQAAATRRSRSSCASC